MDCERLIFKITNLADFHERERIHEDVKCCKGLLTFGEFSWEGLGVGRAWAGAWAGWLAGVCAGRPSAVAGA